ncbi:MAG: phage major capsid protein [Pseudomonadota bacterium]
MSTSEMTARAGTPAPGNQGSGVDVKSALTGFLSEFRTFQDDMKAKFQTQEERLTMLDRKTMISGRPALATTAEVETPHQKAFEAYLRTGNDDGLRGLELEGKALNSSIDGDGGFLVDPQTSATVQGVLTSTASIRAIANVVTVEATSYDVLVDRGGFDTAWATETGTLGETATPQIERVVIPVHELSALPKASQRLLDDAAFDIEAWLADRIGGKFARAESDAFINGDGASKPKGFLTYPTADNDGLDPDGWGTIGYVPTGVDGDFGSADALVELVYSLGAEYRANGTFVMNSKTVGTVRRLKDNDGRFLWSDGLAAGEPARLLGYPVLVAEDMPPIESGSFAIAFGDFRAGYTVAERPELRVLRDPFSAKPHVLFYATKRVGGDVSDFHAIKLLKFSTT